MGTMGSMGNLVARKNTFVPFPTKNQLPPPPGCPLPLGGPLPPKGLPLPGGPPPPLEGLLPPPSGSPLP